MSDKEELGNLSVTLPEARYNFLLARDRFLAALEQAGVDNWDGYDFAVDIYNGE